MLITSYSIVLLGVKGFLPTMTWTWLSFQLRDLVSLCINPDPDQRPDVTYVNEIAQKMHAGHLH